MFKSTSNEMKLMDFKKHKLLGKGAFSKVYLAEYKRKRKYALKEIKKEKLGPDTFLLCFNEIKILKLIKSPHVIRYYGKISTLDRLYICLEYMDGMDLKHAIQVQREKGRIMSERSIWYILHQICYGLKDLHKQKILHRDLKPDNILLTSTCRVKIGDLGLSYVLGKSCKTQKYVCGTLHYSSPEKINEREYGLESDVWALGCIAFEMCAHVSPFAGEKTNVYALKKKVSEGTYPPLPTECYSKEILFFINSCLSLKPENRPTAQMAYKAAHIMFLHFEKMLLKYNRKMLKSNVLNAKVP